MVEQQMILLNESLINAVETPLSILTCARVIDFFIGQVNFSREKSAQFSYRVPRGAQLLT